MDDTQEKSEIRSIVGKAILAHANSATLPRGTTEQEVKMAVREVMRDNPGFFYFSHQWTFEESTSRILLRYTLSADRTREAQRSIDNVVENDFYQGQMWEMRSWPEARRVAYVYKWIAGFCRYNVHSAYNQTIYSVFVYRNSVCTGIAKASQYLLNRLGIESRLVFGRLHHSDPTSRHCWLMVKVDGWWYHHDPTFALPSLSPLLLTSGEREIVGDGHVVWNGFLTSTDVIRRTRTIEEADSLPSCMKEMPERAHLMGIDVKLHRAMGEGCRLASGSTAHIYQHRKVGLVLKAFNYHGEKHFEHEREIMLRLKGCKHLLQIAYHYSRGLVIEQGTPLTDLLQCHYYKLTGQGLCLLLEDVVHGLIECRERGVVYPDIHPGNIYMSPEGSYKLGDFGSCFLLGQSPTKGGVASKWFMAPETYKQEIFDERSQVYMVAMVAYYLLNNARPPFYDKLGEKAIDARMAGDIIRMPAKLSGLKGPFAKALTDFFIIALLPDPANRYDTLEEVLHELETMRSLTTDKVEWEEGLCYSSFEDECDCDSYSGESEATVIPGDNPLLITDGSDCEPTDEEFVTLQPSSVGHRPAPDFCSTYEPDPNVLVSDGGRDPQPVCAPSPSHKRPSNGSHIPNTEGQRSLPCPAPCEAGPSPYIPKSSSPSLWNRLFGRKGREKQPPKKNTTTSVPRFRNGKAKHSDDAYSSVFAPTEVKKGENMLVQVFLHPATDACYIEQLAVQADKNAEKRGYTPLSCKMKKGDTAEVELNIYDRKLIRHEKRSVVYNGAFALCSFRHFVDEDTTSHNLYCEVNTYVNGVPVGSTTFITDIVTRKARNLFAEMNPKKTDRIFVSYSHEDYERVKYLVQGFRAQGIDYFFDRHNLRGGDVFNERIFKYIDRADLFMLCWSENAKHSDYVA